MSWFHPNEAQVEMIRRHAGKKAIEFFCGESPVVRWLPDTEAVTVDKEEDIPESPTHRRAYVEDWITKPDNLSFLRSRDSVVMVYPPNNMNPAADDIVVRAMSAEQKLILGAPRPWGELTIAGTVAFWETLVKDFFVIEALRGDRESQWLYVLTKDAGLSLDPFSSIMQGHDIFELLERQFAIIYEKRA